MTPWSLNGLPSLFMELPVSLLLVAHLVGHQDPKVYRHCRLVPPRDVDHPGVAGGKLKREKCSRGCFVVVVVVTENWLTATSFR